MFINSKYVNKFEYLNTTRFALDSKIKEIEFLNQKHSYVLQ